MKEFSTDIDRGDFSLPDKGRNLIKEVSFVLIATYLVMILITVAICNAEAIDKAFRNLFLWLTT